MKHFSILLTFLCLLIPAFGSEPIEINSSIQDVNINSSYQRVGVVSLEFNSDLIDLGDDISESDPVYLRLRWSDGAALAFTVVDPSGTYTTTNGDAVADAPIDLKLEHTGLETMSLGGGSVAQLAPDLPESAVQLFRAIVGEREAWFRISAPLTRWLDSDFDGIGDSAPSQEHPVRFTFNIEGHLAGNSISESDFDFSGSANVDTYADFGADTAEVDTILPMDIVQNGCGTLGVNDLMNFELVAYMTGVLPGATHSPEADGPNTVDASCSFTGVPTGTYTMLPVSMVGDYTFARGIDDTVLFARLQAPIQVRSGVPVTLINQVFGDSMLIRVAWDFGSHLAITYGTRLDYVFPQAGLYTIDTITTNSNGDIALATTQILVTGGSVLSPNLRRSSGMFTWEVGNDGDAHLDHFQIVRPTNRRRAFRDSGETLLTAMGQQEDFLATSPVYNTHEQPQRVRLVALGADSRPIADAIVILQPGERLNGWMSDLFTDEVLRTAVRIDLD